MAKVRGSASNITGGRDGSCVDTNSRFGIRSLGGLASWLWDSGQITSLSLYEASVSSARKYRRPFLHRQLLELVREWM